MDLWIKGSNMCSLNHKKSLKSPPELWSGSFWPRLWLELSSALVLKLRFSLILLTFSLGWVMLHPPSLIPTSSPLHIHTSPQHHHHHHQYPSDTILEPSQIKKLLSMRKCGMTLHRDITVSVGVFFFFFIIVCQSPAPTSSPLHHRLSPF